MAVNKALVRLTKRTLQDLKDQGFQYVLIKGYSLSRRPDYLELNSFKLTPVRELPVDPALMEIYAPLDSEILDLWTTADSNIEAFIEP